MEINLSKIFEDLLGLKNKHQTYKRMFYLFWIMPIILLSVERYNNNGFAYAFLEAFFWIVITYNLEVIYIPSWLTAHKISFRFKRAKAYKKGMKSRKTKMVRMIRIRIYKHSKNSLLFPPWMLLPTIKERNFILTNFLYGEDRLIPLLIASIIWLVYFKVQMILIIGITILEIFVLFFYSILVNTILYGFN